MKICICCFGLFHRPKQKESIIIQKKTNKKIQKISLNDINSLFPFQNKKRSIELESIKQINQIPLNLNSLRKNIESPYNSNYKILTFKKKINQTRKSLYELKDTFRCLFCGGIKCPCENYKTNPKYAIEGLNCDLIYNEIYASQRPSNLLIEKYNLIKKFNENNIGLIVNLQRPGEHPYCGPNALDPVSGYSYSPSIFSSEGIKVKLSGWKDMDVPDSLYFMLDIIKEIHYFIKIQKKKVLVHCHAGYGRTGIVVACYLIFTYNYNTEKAVAELRNVRKKCIEKNAQMNYCFKFCSFINQLKKVYTDEKYDVDYFIKHQCDLAIDDNKKNNYIPKIIYMCLDLLYKLRFKGNDNYDNNSIYKALNGSLEIKDEDYEIMFKIVDDINNWNWDSFQQINKIVIICELFFNWLEECVSFCISYKAVNELFLNNSFNFEIMEIINGNCDENTIKNVNENIELNFKKLEIEIINYIATFLCNLYPNDDLDKIIEYKRMVEKISIYLLGFNIELLLNFKSKMADKTNDEENDDDFDFEFGTEISIKECIDAIENLIVILEFLRIKIYYSVNKVYDNKMINITKDKFTNNLYSNIKDNTLKSLITSNNESNNNSFINIKSSRTNKLCIEDNNKLFNLSILEGMNYEKNVKKTISPIKNHLIDMKNRCHPSKKISTPINKNKFLDINTYGKSSNINHIKPKSIFGKFENLNDSKLNLKNSNRNNIPIITINYVEKNE